MKDAYFIIIGMYSLKLALIVFTPEFPFKDCKYALGVRSSTTTDAVYAEIGRVSLSMPKACYHSIFFTRLSSLDSQCYARKAFSMLITDVGNGHDNWVSHARDFRVRYEIQNSDTRSIIKTKVNKYFELEVFRRLNEHITGNRELSLYASFKTIFKFESYLDYIQDFTARCTLAKLRMSAHNLQIETGRFSKNKTPRDERFWPYCKTLNTLAVEDEIHFLLTCSLFNEERKRFLVVIHIIFPSTALLNDFNMYIWLRSQDDHNTTKCLATFCKNSVARRSKFLSGPNSI